jgi:hypothetical protein
MNLTTSVARILLLLRSLLAKYTVSECAHEINGAGALAQQLFKLRRVLFPSKSLWRKQQSTLLQVESKLSGKHH